MTQVLAAPDPDDVPPRGGCAPLLGFWGNLAPVVAEMLEARPAWGARLFLAPPEALHAIAVYLHHRLADGGDGADAAALAAALAGRRARDLLHEAAPGAHPRLYRLLARCGPRVLALSTYVASNALLSGVLGAALLRQPLVTAAPVETALRIAADPVLVACAEAVVEDRGHLDNLETGLLLLRARGLAREIEDLPDGSGWRAVAARIAADIAEAGCPAAPFPVPAGWSQPRRWSEITAVGRTMRNCVSSLLAYTGYLEPWIEGRLVVLCAADGSGLATLQHAGQGIWWIAEIDVLQPHDLVERHAAEQALRDGLAAAV